jgi:Smr domain
MYITRPSMEEINIEYGMPTVDVAMPLLSERLRSMKKSGVKAVKIIHGYGSTGKGGRLRKATLKLLGESKESGLLREFVIGEEWSKFELRTLTLIDRMPQLYKDQDLERHNRGITIAFL